MTDEDDGGKLPSVDHGRRTDRGRDKNTNTILVENSEI
jgi:hypothetical protein